MTEPLKEKTYIEKMSEDMAKIREALELLQKYGISKELMVMYIQQKTKLGKGTVTMVLDMQKEFLREAFKPAK